MDGFILANVAPGHYLVIEDNKVIANIRRHFKNDRFYQYPEYNYVLTWENGVREIFAALHEVHTMYHFLNYPGYGAILRTPKDKTSYKRRWKER